MEKMKVEICVNEIVDIIAGTIMWGRIEEIKAELNLLYTIDLELGEQVHKGVLERIKDKPSIPEWKRMALNFH